MGGLIFNAPLYIKMDHKNQNKLAENRTLQEAPEEKVK
jgi:hypothetical protein